MDAIKTNRLCKRYGNKNVVDDLNITIPRGAVYGFIGRNGAGKSTTQKMVCGLANPSVGEVQLFGKPVSDAEVRSKIGTLIEQPGIYPNMSAIQNVILQGYSLGLENPTKAASEALDIVGLVESKKKKAKKLSLGMKQRLGLAIAMLGDPELLILDEPINGLDPEGIVAFRQVIEKINKEKGTTIFISSHILGELSKIATHYGIIKDGKLVEEVTSTELAKKRNNFLQVKVDDTERAAVLIELELNISSSEIQISTDNEIHVLNFQDTGAVNRLLSRNGLNISEIFLHQQDLEEYFVELMGGKDHE